MGRLGAPVNDGTACADRAYAVVPADGSDFEHGVATGFIVGTGGDVAILPEFNDDPVTIKNIPDGGFIPIRSRRILATGTTASDIIALYN